MRWFLLAFFAVFVIHPNIAQEAPSWCPLEVEAEGEIAAIPSPFIEMTIEDETVIVLPSSDGELVAFLQPDGELWAADSDGQNPRVVLDAETLAAMRDPYFSEEDLGIDFNLSLYRFEWIPETHQLIFSTSQKPKRAGIYIFIPDDLWLIDVESGEAENLVPQGEGGEFVLSPDGRYAAVMRSKTLFIYDIEDRERINVDLEAYEAYGFGEYIVYPQIVWSPDSGAFLILTTKNPYQQYDNQVSVWHVPVDNPPTEVGTFPAAYISAAISPDSEYIAYWSTPEEGSNLRRFSISDVEGHETVNFLEEEGFEFQGWSDHYGYFFYSEGVGEPVLIGDICGGKHDGEDTD